MHIRTISSTSWKPFANCFLLIITLLLSGALFCSCSDDEDYLSLSTDKIDSSVDGQKTSFTISSNMSWKVAVADSWTRIDYNEGSGDATITVTIDPNQSGVERTTTLSVSSGTYSEKILITQETVNFTLSANEFVFDALGTPQKLTITSNYKWQLSIPTAAAWCEADILSGEGDAVVTFTPAPYTERVARSEVKITFSVFNMTPELVVSQEITNEAPSIPLLLTPGNNSDTVEFPISFSWKPSTDADGDVVIYSLYLSTDGETWGEAFAETTDTDISVTAGQLNEQTVYYWKVIAKDAFNGESESEVYTFILVKNEVYSDGEVLVYQAYSATDVTRPVNLIVMGDGFIEADYTKGGAFDLAVQKAVDAFFSVEPFPTYREYFTVYKVAAYSEERGATVKNNFYYAPVYKQTKNTVFSSVFEGGTSTGVECDDNAVFSYALKIPGITENELDNTTILLIVNLDVYAGTTYMWSFGKSIAICPTGDYFEEIVYHECGGHGFGRLLDEYIYSGNETFPQSNITTLNLFRRNNVWSYGANISITNNLEEVHWKHYFTKSGYDMVNVYEGAALYGKGVWRPEYNSCMNDNTPYFNAPSREAIVRRIMSVNGKGFDYEAYYSKDVIQPVTRTRSQTTRLPLAPPVMMK